MKTTKILSLFLCLLLLLSTFLVACNKPKENNEGNKGGGSSNVVSDEAFNAISNDISAINLGALIDAVTNTSSEALSDMLEGIACEGGATLDMGGQNMNVYAGMKDGIFKMSFWDTNVDDAYVLFNGNDIIFLGSYENGYEISVIPGQEAADMAEGMISDKMINILKNFKLPAISKSQLTKEGDSYMVANSYWETVAKKVVDTAIDLMIEAGMPESATPSDEYFDSMIQEVLGMVDELGIKLGFTVSNNRISGIVLNVETTASKIMTVTGEMPADDFKDGPVTATVKFNFIPDTLIITSVAASFSATAEGQTYKIDAALSTKLDSNNQPIGLDATLTVNAPNTRYYDEIYLGKSDDMYDDYAYIYLAGTMTIKLSAHVDLSKISSANEKIVDVSYSLDQIYTGYTVEVYNHDTWEYEELDPSKYDVEVTPSDYNAKTAVGLVITAKGNNAFEFTANYLEDGFEFSYTGDMSFDLEAAAGFGELPEDVADINSRENFIDTYNALSELADELYAQLYNFNYSGPMDEMIYETFYIYHDAESGLYILFEGADIDPIISTGAPERDDLDYHAITIDPTTGEVVIVTE